MSSVLLVAFHEELAKLLIGLFRSWIENRKAQNRVAQNRPEPALET
jgi:hypothetical protein